MTVFTCDRIIISLFLLPNNGITHTENVVAESRNERGHDITLTLTAQFSHDIFSMCNCVLNEKTK